MPEINRRDFLKLISLLPLPLLRAPLRKMGLDQSSSQKNILIIVYDAWTTKNISLFGYPRETMPNLARLSERAIVYHNHHAASDFTTPGTASLLTGTLPWTHRAVNIAAKIMHERVGNNIFDLFNGYHSIAYSHNVLVNILLKQMLQLDDLKEFLPFHEMLLYSDWVARLFSEDSDLASVARFYILNQENPLTNSLFLSDIINALEDKAYQRFIHDYEDSFPLGLPRSTRNTHYILESSREWLTENLPVLPQPFLGYFHFLPPHAPYRTRADFIDRFDDGWEPVKKPDHFMTEGMPRGRIQLLRRQYDEFIAYVDDEFAKLYHELEDHELLENTVLVLTSDHGEIFERRLSRHGTNTFYEPIIKIPLMIFDPDRNSRLDVFEPSSAIDVLPTLLQLNGLVIPSWIEGNVLPPYRISSESGERAVLALTAKDNAVYNPYTKGTYAIVKNGYKMVAYEGYTELPNGETYTELYDLENDPEELENIFSSKPGLADELLGELMERKARADEPFK